MRLGRWCKQRTVGVLHLLLAFLILLGTSGCAAALLAGSEGQAAAEKAEEEANNPSPQSVSLRLSRRVLVKATIHALPALAEIGVAKANAEIPSTGHFLPNGLRAPLRC